MPAATSLGSTSRRLPDPGKVLLDVASTKLISCLDHG